MAETKPNTPTQTTSGGQNTIVIVLAALLILAGIFVFLNTNGRGNPSAKENKRLEELRKRVEAKERDLRAQGYDIPMDSVSLDELVDRVSRDALELKSSASKLQKTLSDKDRELRKLKAELEASITINERHGSEATKLRNQLAQLQTQQNDVAFLNQQVNDLKAQVVEKDLQITELASRPDGNQFTEISKELNTSLLRNKELEAEVAQLTSLKNTMVSPSEVQSIKDQLAKLTPENEELKLTVQQLRAEIDHERLYVKSGDKLLPSSAKLYRELQKLEELDQEQLKAAYIRIDGQFNARVIKNVKFDKGETTVGFSDQAEIHDRLADVKPGSDILIVGYASKTGDAEQNEKLSAQRATTTASVVDHLLNQKKDVQAVYLGQTGRFSEAADENKICEIWEIRK